MRSRIGKIALSLLLFYCAEPLTADTLKFHGTVYPLPRQSTGRTLTFRLPEVGILWKQPCYLELPSLPAGTTLMIKTATATSKYPLPATDSSQPLISVQLPDQTQSFALSPIPADFSEVQFLLTDEPTQTGENLSLQIGPQETTIHLPPSPVVSGRRLSYAFQWEGEAPVKITLNRENENLHFLIKADSRLWNFYPSLWDFQPTRITFQGSNFRLLKTAAQGTSPGRPFFTDALTFLRSPASAWRQETHDFFQWEDQPSILVLMSKDYATQDRFLKRLAFYVEKPGFRGRLAADEEIEKLHGWNAHDYAPVDLAGFFNLAQNTGFQLHPEEVLLRDTLTRQGILSAEDGGWRPGTGALLGLSLQSDFPLREFFFTHEAFHGLYFLSPEFRAETKKVWMSLSAEARKVFTAYLEKLTYDPTSRALMVNEFQAYLLQQKTTDSMKFFTQKVLAPRKGQGEKVTSAPDPELLKEFLAATEELDRWVWAKFHVRAGMVNPVSMGSSPGRP